jgi:hypothetical protein
VQREACRIPVSLAARHRHRRIRDRRPAHHSNPEWALTIMSIVGYDPTIANPFAAVIV